MTDRELIEAAARAVRLPESGWMANSYMYVKDNQFTDWNPLTDDDDALRLAVALEVEIRCFNGNAHAGRQGKFWCTENWFPDGDRHAATRRAIVRAAASLNAPGGTIPHEGRESQ